MRNRVQVRPHVHVVSARSWHRILGLMWGTRAHNGSPLLSGLNQVQAIGSPVFYHWAFPLFKHGANSSTFSNLLFSVQFVKKRSENTQSSRSSFSLANWLVTRLETKTLLTHLPTSRNGNGRKVLLQKVGWCWYTHDRILNMIQSNH